MDPLANQRVQQWSLHQIVLALFTLLTELRQRLVPGVQGDVEQPVVHPAPAAPALQVPFRCGFQCAIHGCENPCTRGDEGHRHHKCRRHRHL